MKLVISTYDDLGNPYYSGGGAIAVREIASRLGNHFQITVLTAKYPGAIDAFHNQVFYKHIGPAWAGPRLGQLIFQGYTLWYSRILSYDLWLESFTPPFSASLLPLFAKSPVIGLVHMLSAVDMQRKYKLPFLLVERWILLLYRNLICPSKYYSQQIKDYHPQVDIAVIPNGVNAFPSQSKTSSRRNYISFLGRIEINQKGLDLLLKSFKIMSAHSSTRLQIAGNGNAAEIKNLKQMISDLGLQSRVLLLGRINDREKIDFFNRSLVLAVPSRHETFSMSALESLSAGVPYVSFNIPGLDWLPASCGIKVPRFQIKSFAQSLNSICQDRKLRQEYSLQAKKFSRSFSWENSGRQYFNYLNHVRKSC